MLVKSTSFIFIQVYDFELSNEDMDALSNLKKGRLIAAER